MAVADLLDRLITIQRKARTADGASGFKLKFSPIATDVPARISALTPRAIPVSGQNEAIVTNAVYVMPGTDLKLGDRVIDADETFEIRTGNQATGGYPYMKFMAEKYTHG